MTPNYYSRTRRAVLETPALPVHAARLLEDVRDADLNEWVAFTGLPMGMSLGYAVSPGLTAMSCYLEASGKMLALFGAHPMPAEFVESYGCSPEAGLLWFAATNLGYSHLPDFAVLTHEGLRYLHDAYPHLTAFVDDRNVAHHQWLVEMGFTFAPEPFAMGPWGLPFWRVDRRQARKA